MHIWRAVRGEGSELGIWPEPRVLPHILGWDRKSWGGEGMLETVEGQRWVGYVYRCTSSHADWVDYVPPKL